MTSNHEEIPKTISETIYRAGLVAQGVGARCS